MQLNPDYGEARFIVAMVSTALAGIFLVMGLIHEVVWGTLQGSIIGLYSIHSMIDDKFRDCKNDSNSIQIPSNTSSTP